jgi:hypothetical protein
LKSKSDSKKGNALAQYSTGMTKVGSKIDGGEKRFGQDTKSSKGSKSGGKKR